MKPEHELRLALASACAALCSDNHEYRVAMAHDLRAEHGLLVSLPGDSPEARESCNRVLDEIVDDHPWLADTVEDMRRADNHERAEDLRAELMEIDR